MKRLIPIIIILTIFGLKAYSQIEYSRKIETGYLGFQYTMVQVEAGPNWKGYNLNKEQNGIDVNLINGIQFKNKLFAGIGLGYVNFDGINGISVFSDFEYLPLKTKLTPLINLKIGYNHIWNQYKNGTGTALIELGGGLNYRFSEKFGVYLQSGFMITQQTFFIPIKLGLRI